MKMILPLIFLCLTACGGSDDDSALATDQQLASIQQTIPPNESTAMQAIRAQMDSLQASVRKLQLIGHPSAVSASNDAVHTLEMLGEPIVGSPSAVTAVGQFGPCADMGVQEASLSNAGIQEPLAATFKAFKNCTKYHAEYATVDGSLKPTERLYSANSNCTPPFYTFEDFGNNYDTETLKDGVVFANPQDGTPLMVTANQTPQPTLFQSVWVRVNPGCQPDVETQAMYQVVPNQTSVSGVPNSAVGPYTTGSP